MKKILIAIMLAMGVGMMLPGVAWAERMHDSVATQVQGETPAPNPQKCVKNNGFLGFRPWYAGLTDANCNIETPKQEGEGMTMVRFIWTIVLNITSSLISASGLVLLGMMIAGGFMYIASNGDSSKVVKAKGTLTGAVIGMVIVIFAGVITNTIIAVMTGGPK